MEVKDPWDSWAPSTEILVFLAHPDDPEFFCGATVANWTHLGFTVDYCLFTKGQKGSDDPQMDPQRLATLRMDEQRRAARVLGVRSVEFLDFQDGELVPDLRARQEVVRVIRSKRPQVVVSCDPTNLFPSDHYLNHPDHRAAGQAVIDGLFPGAGNRMFFPELLAEGLEPVEVHELWLSNPSKPEISVDVTAFWNQKIEALHAHASQIGDVEEFDKGMLQRAEQGSDGTRRFVERFRRLTFS